MTFDYGSGRPRPTPVWPWVIGLLALVAIAVLVHLLLNNHRKALIAEAKAWTVNGPPCPTLSKEAYAAQPYQARQAFETAGIRWARASAIVMCQTISEDGGFNVHPVCQFSAPAVLRITTSKGDYFFAPGPGKRASVSVKDGVASCVMGTSVDFTN